MMKMFFTFIILLPASKLGYGIKEYKSLKKSLFFDSFFKITFNSYLCFVFVAKLTLTSPEED